GAHGFNATLEDWGRFGEFILHNGTLPNGKQILPEDWVAQSSHWTRAAGSVSAAHPNGIYGFQWWNNEVPVNATNVE
ncbi:serine hydrolase, partial [Pseudomonas aeruginosa]